MSTIENEEYLHSCCKALGLPPLSLLTLGLREITASLRSDPWLTSPVLLLTTQFTADGKVSTIGKKNTGSCSTLAWANVVL